jgi:hypothetical protein
MMHGSHFLPPLLSLFTSRKELALRKLSGEERGGKSKGGFWNRIKWADLSWSEPRNRVQIQIRVARTITDPPY